MHRMRRLARHAVRARRWRWSLKVDAGSPPLHTFWRIRSSFRAILITRSWTVILGVSRCRSSVLRSDVLPRCLASLLALSRVFAGQPKLNTVGAWVSSVALGSQLVALVAGARDAPSHRLTIRSRGPFILGRRVLPTVLDSFPAAVAVAVPVIDTVNRLRMLHGVWRAFWQSIEAARLVREVIRRRVGGIGEVLLV